MNNAFNVCLKSNCWLIKWLKNNTGFNITLKWIQQKACTLHSAPVYCTLVRSWYLRGCWETVLAVTREADGILWSNRAALGPLSPARPWAAGTREPVWVSLDWKSCCSNTLSLAAGHKAHTQREGGRKITVKRSNSIGGNKGVDVNKERWDEQI